MRWEFVTRPVRGAGYVAWNWAWRAIDDEGTVRVSDRSFTTFNACVADARLHGFTGDADPTGFAPNLRSPQAPFFWS